MRRSIAMTEFMTILTVMMCAAPSSASVSHARSVCLAELARSAAFAQIDVAAKDGNIAFPHVYHLSSRGIDEKREGYSGALWE